MIVIILITIIKIITAIAIIAITILIMMIMILNIITISLMIIAIKAIPPIIIIMSNNHNKCNNTDPLTLSRIILILPFFPRWKSPTTIRFKAVLLGRSGAVLSRCCFAFGLKFVLRFRKDLLPAMVRLLLPRDASHAGTLLSSKKGYTC